MAKEIARGKEKVYAVGRPNKIAALISSCKNSFLDKTVDGFVDT